MGVAMKIISSEAGERLAKAKAALDSTEMSSEAEVDGRLSIAMYDFDQAARAVADELISHGFGNAEGD